MKSEMTMNKMLAEDVNVPELRNPLLWGSPRNGWFRRLFIRMKTSRKP